MQYTEKVIDEEDAAETSYREVEILDQLMAQHADFRGPNDSYFKIIIQVKHSFCILGSYEQCKPFKLDFDRFVDILINNSEVL